MFFSFVKPFLLDVIVVFLTDMVLWVYSQRPHNTVELSVCQHVH